MFLLHVPQQCLASFRYTLWKERCTWQGHANCPIDYSQTCCFTCASSDLNLMQQYDWWNVCYGLKNLERNVLQIFTLALETYCIRNKCRLKKRNKHRYSHFEILHPVLSSFFFEISKGNTEINFEYYFQNVWLHFYLSRKLLTGSFLMGNFVTRKWLKLIFVEIFASLLKSFCYLKVNPRQNMAIFIRTSYGYTVKEHVGHNRQAE